MAANAFGALFHRSARSSRRGLNLGLCSISRLLGGSGRFPRASSSLRREFASRLGPTAFGRKFPHVVGNQNRALEHDLFARFARIFLHGQIGAHAMLKARNIARRHLKSSQKKLRRSAVARLYGFDLARFDIERDVAHEADRRFVGGHDRQALP